MSTPHSDLREAFDAFVTEQLEDGERVTVADLWDVAAERFSDLIEADAEQLACISGKQILRQALRKAQKKGRMDQPIASREASIAQNVPRYLAVPQSKKAGDLHWVPTMKATVSEVESNIVYRRNGATADMAKAGQTRQWLDAVVEASGSDEIDVPIDEMLFGEDAKNKRRGDFK